MTAGISFADITTIGVGGFIHRFVEPGTSDELIRTVSQADRNCQPLCVIGGGSNLLVSDAPFPGVVVRYAARGVHEVESDRSQERGGVHQENHEDAVGAGSVRLRVDAGGNWDDFVSRTIGLGLNGVEGLSGIPGTVGASVVQNIGAYGQEIASSVDAVDVWDRLEQQRAALKPADLGFGYRTSALKRSMIRPDGSHDPRWYPTPRFVVLAVTFTLHKGSVGTIGYDQLAHALGLPAGDIADTRDIRAAVLRIRAAKGMLEDAHRYELASMRGVKDAAAVEAAIRAEDAEGGRSCADGNGQNPQQSARVRAQAVTRRAGIGVPQDSEVLGQQSGSAVSDRHSCGSFFINPIMSPQQAASLPAYAPRFPAALPDGTVAVKASAAWLIDHAGFHKGFALTADAPAGVSTRHTLALVNRGGAKAGDVAALARHIQHGVFEHFGVRLIPEPVVYGLEL